MRSPNVPEPTPAPGTEEHEAVQAPAPEDTRLRLLFRETVEVPAPTRPLPSLRDVLEALAGSLQDDGDAPAEA